MRDVAAPAVAAPAYVVGTGRNATLSPTEIGTFLKFDPDGSGGLRPRVDVPAAQAVVDRDLASTEAEPKDASFAFQGAAATVVPAVTGRQIDYPKTFAGLVEALGKPGDPAPPTTFTPPPPAARRDPGAPAARVGPRGERGLHDDAAQGHHRVAAGHRPGHRHRRVPDQRLRRPTPARTSSGSPSRSTAPP